MLMGTYHDQNQNTIKMVQFIVPEDMKEGIREIIKRSKRNKSPGVDGVHNEMLKIEMDLSTELILELWRLLGRTNDYPKERGRGLLTPIYKKVEPSTPANHRPV